MIRSRRIATSLLGALVLLATAPAVSEPAEPAGSLIEAMKTALGGTEAIAGIRSMAVEAVCSGPGGPFTTQLHSIRGGGTFFRQPSDDRRTEIWSTAEATWTIDADGARKEHPAQVRSFVRGHEFHLLVLEFEERFSNRQSVGRERFAGRAAHKIRMTDAENLPATLWIDQETDLPLAIETNPAGAAGAVRVTFENWETFDGVELFRAFTLTEGAERAFRYDYVAIELNPAANGSFHAPAGLSAASSRQAIEKILQADREAHLKTDASLLAGHLADELVEVSDGEIRTQTREQILEFFEGSFLGAKFHAWEDIQAPAIRLSADGSMAWVVRRVRADREDSPDGKPVRTRYSSAYTATYEKQAGEWRMTSVTSTFLPPAGDS